MVLQPEEGARSARLMMRAHDGGMVGAKGDRVLACRPQSGGLSLGTPPEVVVLSLKGRVWWSPGVGHLNGFGLE